MLQEESGDYLFYAPHFTIYTDNNSLTYVMSTAKLNAIGFGGWENCQILDLTYSTDQEKSMQILFQGAPLTLTDISL